MITSCKSRTMPTHGTIENLLVYPIASKNLQCSNLTASCSHELIDRWCCCWFFSEPTNAKSCSDSGEEVKLCYR